MHQSGLLALMSPAKTIGVEDLWMLTSSLSKQSMNSEIDRAGNNIKLYTREPPICAQRNPLFPNPIVELSISTGVAASI